MQKRLQADSRAAVDDGAAQALGKVLVQAKAPEQGAPQIDRANKRSYDEHTIEIQAQRNDKNNDGQRSTVSVSTEYGTHSLRD